MEREFLSKLADRIPAHPRAPLGVGDDAAIVTTPTGRCVVSTDMLSDEVDFLLTECLPTRIGRKALAVNLSDMAAMAAKPIAAFVSVLLPETGAADLADQLSEGILKLAKEFDVALPGGDTNVWPGKLAISVTILGDPTEHGVWQRDGAKSGDAILVTGKLGGSILGKHFDFEPRVREALLLNERYEINAALDISDGFAIDLDRLAVASGLGAQVDLNSLPISRAAEQLSQRTGKTPLAHALGDGEDFELLFTASSDVAKQLLADQPLDIEIRQVGEMIPTPGLWSSDRSVNDSSLKPLAVTGFEHGN